MPDLTTQIAELEKLYAFYTVDQMDPWISREAHRSHVLATSIHAEIVGLIKLQDQIDLEFN